MEFVLKKIYHNLHTNERIGSGTELKRGLSFSCVKFQLIQELFEKFLRHLGGARQNCRDGFFVSIIKGHYPT